MKKARMNAISSCPAINLRERNPIRSRILEREATGKQAHIQHGFYFSLICCPENSTKQQRERKVKGTWVFISLWSPLLYL